MSQISLEMIVNDLDELLHCLPLLLISKNSVLSGFKF